MSVHKLKINSSLPEKKSVLRWQLDQEEKHHMTIDTVCIHVVS